MDMDKPFPQSPSLRWLSCHRVLSDRHCSETLICKAKDSTGISDRSKGEASPTAVSQSELAGGTGASQTLWQPSKQLIHPTAMRPRRGFHKLPCAPGQYASGMNKDVGWEG
ncbi:unnamed protein product [Natator depressus]